MTNEVVSYAVKGETHDGDVMTLRKGLTKEAAESHPVKMIYWRRVWVEEQCSSALKSRDATTQTVSLAEAPIQAWQQAVLPNLKNLARELYGEDEEMVKSLVLVGLIYLKESDSPTWMEEVTGWGSDDLGPRLVRAFKCGLVMLNGKPNRRLFADLESDDGGLCTVSLILLAGVVNGTFTVTSDGLYSLGDCR